ncbi:bifunctional UDP-N-acetylmuramoyl-tripeptide:D-alanyl-D-alanine ligase/alanine racemase [Owenweeksia hongkongensis]|uniref:bifunctional UDP-N-acetylmuramoyl-tripeptide:D-alanyl-D-alanine ligase/alanine racemase n=1 Tax=Owenweeksia hongkongensis TaxID=253245 RepID=UPI003A942202
MAHLAISKIAELLKAQFIGAHPQEIVSRLLLDSRQFSSAEGVLFFALRGKNHDGHKYIEDLVKKGVRHFVVEQRPTQTSDANFVVVPDSLKALQDLAKHIREQSSAAVIAVTGSNGKTVVKEWMGQILQKQFSTCRSPKSYNSQIGVPLSVWELEAKNEFAVFESGISEPGEMEKLEKILQPEIGIFTNIGSAHDANFESSSEKIAEKLKLFKHSKQMVYEANGSNLAKQIEVFTEERGIQLLSWTRENGPADLRIEVKIEEAQTVLIGTMDERTHTLQIPFTDAASIQNAIHCWRLGLELSLDEEEMKKSFAKLNPVEMRLQMKAGSNGNIIINDAYNSDMESLRVALHYLENQAGNRKKVLIISELQQSGLASEELFSRMAEVINRFELDEIIAIGKDLKNGAFALNSTAIFYPSTKHFLKNIYSHSFKQSAILLKGARSFHFEEISSALEEKSHQTVLNIYMNRMVYNLNYFRSKLNGGTRIMAMVKAFSYGSGTYEIANLLQFHKVDYLGVAYTDEGVALRKAGISLPILVLNAEPSSFHDLVEYNLEPEVYSFHQLEMLENALKNYNLSEAFKVHLKVETGMHRLGFEEDQLKDLAEKLKSHRHIKVASVFSHLAASDDPELRDFTLGQVTKLKQMTDKLKSDLGYDFLRHISNSSGISQYPEAHFDMVRLGVGLYGIGSNEEDRKHLNVVSDLMASVSQVKQLKIGDSVSYGRTFVAEKPTTIAVVSIGYADGFRRSLSNGVGEVAISGKRYQVVGRVCMDMVMVDVTGSDVAEGDEVEVFGPTISVYELAQKMDTIPYEVLTGISSRVKRVYFME